MIFWIKLKTRKIKEVDETRTSELIFSEKFIDDRKKLNIKCETENASLKDIYEVFKKAKVNLLNFIILNKFTVNYKAKK